MKIQLKKPKTETQSNNQKTENVSQTKQNPFLSGNENTTNPFIKSAPTQFAGLGGFFKAGKRFVGNVFAGKGINASVEDVKKHNNQKNDDPIGYRLKDPELRDLFYNFLKQEDSPENLDAYFLTQKTIDTGDTSIFTNLYNNFIKNEVINVDKKTKSACEDVMDKIDSKESVVINKDLLLPLYRSLSTNLHDSYSRFTPRKVYQDYQKRKGK